ncbi:GNAT family N-acetyltransferase [Rhodovibrionaceae bacterium A322]
MKHQLIQERPQDAELIEALHDRTFGKDRIQRTVYSLRTPGHFVPDLSLVAIDDDGELLGSIRYWPLKIGERDAILLGPLSVQPHLQGKGIGKSLIRNSLTSARRCGHDLCIVVGDPDYYAVFGFQAASAFGLILPGPVEPARFQVCELRPGALDGATGLISSACMPTQSKAQKHGLSGH